MSGMSIKCATCENRGTIWLQTDCGFAKAVQCPECEGKSHKEFNVAAMRAKLQKRIAEKKEPRYHEMDIFECLAEIERVGY